VDPQQKYININNLDDLKNYFIEKKKIANETISEAERKTMDSFIDFLKGLLRIESTSRWTPLMAMKHPFITRQ